MTTPRIPKWAGIALLLILGFDLWWRCHTIGPTIRGALGFAPYPVVTGEAEPLDCDEAAYAYIGRGLVHGKVLYRDLSENKPPMGYWLYALAVAIGGANETTIRLMALPYVLATIALVWWIGLRLRGPVAGCLAALGYAVLSTDPYLYGNGSNMEHFLNLFTVGSLAAMVRAAGPADRRWIILAGALVGAASLVKQVAALDGPIYALTLLLIDRGEALEGGRWARKLKDLLALAGGFAIVWAVAILVLWLQGAGSAAYDDIVTYGSALATLKVPDPNAPSKLVRWITGNADPQGRLPWPFDWMFGKTDYLVWWGTGSWPTWLASIPAVGWLLIRRDARRRLLAAWTICAWVQVAAPGLFWAHYYLLPTPGLSLCLAVAFIDAGQAFRTAWRPFRFGRLIVSTTAILAFLAAGAWTARLQVRDYLMVAPEDLTSRFKGGYQWVVLRDMGRDLARRTSEIPDAKLYVWGWQSPLLIYSGLDSPTRHFFADPLLEDYSRGLHRDDPRVRPRVERIMKDLEADPPTLAFVAYPPFPELRKFLEARYVRSPLGGIDVSQAGGLGLWVLRRSM
ncbi:ArnT family glycosyltransferase [Tundrisphaera lichenicola]|uniref:ArnT family glycosyltransferase n=1 Tax=Tundrisphaera lichenicola TaxID=2029860 RepID=UPI003EBBE943